MKLLIDADGCPVVNLAISEAKKLKIEVIIFCDSSHHFESQYARVITVMKGRDAVDFELIKYISSGDIAVTQDYGLAAMVLSKEGRCINQNGLIYTVQNIDQLLFSRHEAARIRRSGTRIKGPKKRTQGDNDAFTKSLKSLFTNGLQSF